MGGGQIAGAGYDWDVGFCGYRFNPETANYTVRFRHYDPAAGLGRWLERDPAGYVDGGSLYEYAAGQPLEGLDPTGLDVWIIHRELNPLSQNDLAPAYTILSHSFVAVTGRGEIHTYSWGNQMDLRDDTGMWSKDAPEDLSAAKKALDPRWRWGRSDGLIIWSYNWQDDSSLDEFVEEEFNYRKFRHQDLTYHISRRHGWELFNNCKHEASRLINEARVRRAMTGQLSQLGWKRRRNWLVDPPGKHLRLGKVENFSELESQRLHRNKTEGGSLECKQ